MRKDSGVVPRGEREFYMLGGKGGVGKTSCSASLAVELGSMGLKTLVVSTDPAHSLSDSVDQDLSNRGYVFDVENENENENDNNKEEAPPNHALSLSALALPSFVRSFVLQ